LPKTETLEFAANMKIPSRGEALEEIKKLLDDFELQKTENTYVGGQILKGLSGGEKKRLCIAIEMVSKPSVLILDEPTSGLDSNKAARVLSILKKLASHGHTIVFTLHQPSYLQYIKLDRLILLSRGETVYQGPAKEIVPYM
jgi:ABC-type multidrug transport system ATPase subunit